MRKYLYQLATDKRNDVLSNILKAFFYCLSLIYGFCAGLIKFLYRIKILKSHRLNCKVISIGNITLGGTGKTPMVGLLVKHLKQKGRRVGVLIRGYGRYKSVGDEALMLKEAFDVPVIAGRDRVKNAKFALQKYGLDTLILDDGFQHWRLQRDLDIVLIDAFSSFGNHHLLPRGILREPLESLKRADIFVLTKADTVMNTLDLRQFLKDFYPDKLSVEAVHRPIALELFDKDRVENIKGNLDLAQLKNKPICAFCGIGDPGYFEDTLKRLGAEIKLSFRFPDHYEYKRKDLQKIYLACQKQGIDTIITTQKDAVRLEPVVKQVKSLSINIFVLKIEMNILKDEKSFFRKVDSVFR